MQVEKERRKEKNVFESQGIFYYSLNKYSLYKNHCRVWKINSIGVRRKSNACLHKRGSGETGETGESETEKSKASLDVGVNKVLNFRSPDGAQPSHSWTICIIYL